MCPFLEPNTNTLKVYFCYCMYCAQLYLRVFAIVTASCAVSNRESLVPSLICVIETMLLKEPSRLRTLAKKVKLMQNAASIYQLVASDTCFRTCCQLAALLDLRRLSLLLEYTEVEAHKCHLRRFLLQLVLR